MPPRTSTKNPAAAPVLTQPPRSPDSDHGHEDDGGAEDIEVKAGSSAPASFIHAKLRVMTAVSYVRKRGRMTGGGAYPFVRDTDVIAALRGPMIENGLALCGPTRIANRETVAIKTSGNRDMFCTRAEFTFELRSMLTEEKEEIVVIGEGADSLDKSSNKAMSAARKYALMLTFNLTTGDDPDAFDDQGNHSGGEADRPAQKPKSEVKPEMKTESPPADIKLAPTNNHPATGQELYTRISDYDRKLSEMKLCARGELLSHVVQAGVRTGYTANMADWSGNAIAFAVDEVKRLEASYRADMEKRHQKAGEAAAAQTAARVIAVRSEEAKAATRAAMVNTTQATQPPVLAPPSGSPPLAVERFDKRIAGMNLTGKKENLDAFRKLYTADAEMTSDQKTSLEKCYWDNVQRIAAAVLRT